MSGRFGKMALDAGGKTPKSFWSYQAPDTPSLEEAIRLGAIKRGTTPEEWDKMSPGMKREVVRSAKKTAGDAPRAKQGMLSSSAVNEAYRGYLIREGSGLFHVSKGGQHVYSAQTLDQAKRAIDQLV